MEETARDLSIHEDTGASGEQDYTEEQVKIMEADKLKQAQDGEAMYKLMYSDYPASMDIYDN